MDSKTIVELLQERIGTQVEVFQSKKFSIYGKLSETSNGEYLVGEHNLGSYTSCVWFTPEDIKAITLDYILLKGTY